MTQITNTITIDAEKVSIEPNGDELSVTIHNFDLNSFVGEFNFEELMNSIVDHFDISRVVDYAHAELGRDED